MSQCRAATRTSWPPMKSSGDRREHAVGAGGGRLRRHAARHRRAVLRCRAAMRTSWPSEAGLRVIDVSTPSAPVEVGFVDTPVDAFGVAVAGGYAYVAAGDAGLRVIDVSTPSAPVEVGFLDTPGGALDVAVSGCYAYVADSDAGLRVIDVSTSSAPVEVGFIDTPGWADDVAVAGSYAYVASDDSGAGGLHLIDVGEPSSPGGSWVPLHGELGQECRRCRTAAPTWVLGAGTFLAAFVSSTWLRRTHWSRWGRYPRLATSLKSQWRMVTPTSRSTTTNSP